LEPVLIGSTAALGNRTYSASGVGTLFATADDSTWQECLADSLGRPFDGNYVLAVASGGGRLVGAGAHGTDGKQAMVAAGTHARLTALVLVAH
jgi:hypothetical protein